MQHRTLGFAAVGAAAAGLCAVLATTAPASSGHGTASRTVEHTQTVAKDAARQKATSDDRTKTQTKNQSSEENRQLLKIQMEIKRTPAGPTGAQVTEADRLVGELKAQGRATAAQLAWLALTPAEKRVEAAPVGTD
ncbi:hypothetical protein [Streptomyces sp. NPDC051572]|uniref:hypothetical protein n=1 Tax=Streptomyces sp. NPDC051572 TaxID=3155802 RepID=UPI00344D681E